MPLDNVNSQQMSIAANLAAAEGIEKLLENEIQREQEAVDKTKVEESTIKRALEGKSDKLGIEIIAGLASKLAQMMPTSQIIKNIGSEYGLEEDQVQEEQTDDYVEIKNPLQMIARAKKQKQNLGGEAGSQNGQGSEGETSPKEDIKEYIGAYTQMLVNGGGEKKQKVARLEEKLVNDKTLELKDVKGLKVHVANSVRQEILQQVKRSFLKQILSKEKTIEHLIAKREVAKFIDFAFVNDALGGYDFGGLDGNLQSAVDNIRSQTKHELQDFIKDEISDQVMKKAIKEHVHNEVDGKIEKDIEELLRLGTKVGFDLNGFLGKVHEMKEHLGLNPAIEFEYFDAGAAANNNSQQQGHRYKYTPEEEKELLTDKLRAIYLRRALQGDVRTVLETQFKMIKLKNGLIKLGAKNFDEIETEGKAIARIKLMEMLREGFEERATYAKLSGEAWKMTERKIKTVLKNLENIGSHLSQTELDSMRDKANIKMHQEAEHELSLINTAIEARGEIKYLTTKRQMAVGILERIAGETGLSRPGQELSQIKEAV